MSTNILELQRVAKEYIIHLQDVASDVNEINRIRYELDSTLSQIIEKSEPPYFLDYKLFNYKALLLYFMQNFRNNIKVQIPTIDLNINVNINIENLFHLVNIKNKNSYIRKNKIHEKVIYDILKFQDYGENEKAFKNKIASIAWLKNTLQSPDLIYDESANCSKYFNFDLLFVRECGMGTKSQPYMYHLVGLRKTSRDRYVVISQFPIEKDRQRSSETQKVSRLYCNVDVNKPIYKKDGVVLPKDGINIDNLRDSFGGF